MLTYKNQSSNEQVLSYFILYTYDNIDPYNNRFRRKGSYNNFKLKLFRLKIYFIFLKNYFSIKNLVFIKIK